MDLLLGMFTIWLLFDLITELMITLRIDKTLFCKYSNDRSTIGSFLPIDFAAAIANYKTDRLIRIIKVMTINNINDNIMIDNINYI